MNPGAFVTSTGTGAGKTFVARGLARALLRRQLPVAAIKPLETGADPHALDALALARAAGRPSLGTATGLFRARLPLSPYAACLESSEPCPEPDHLARRIRSLADPNDFLLVEGAGGLLVPLSPRATIADLAQALGFPLVLVAQDALGVLSHVLTAAESIDRRRLPVAALILARHAQSSPDPSTRTNAAILRERLPFPVLHFPHTPDDDDALAAAVEDIQLLDQLLPAPVSAGG